MCSYFSRSRKPRLKFISNGEEVPKVRYFFYSSLDFLNIFHHLISKILFIVVVLFHFKISFFTITEVDSNNIKKKVFCVYLLPIFLHYSVFTELYQVKIWKPRLKLFPIVGTLFFFYYILIFKNYKWVLIFKNSIPLKIY